MRTFIMIILVSLLQFKNISCQSEYGSIFPIPLTIPNEDPSFEQCPDKNGVYVHTSNCSLFHMCNIGIHAIYSCIDGFFFNPTSRRCQYLPIEKEAKCDTILQTMQDSLVEFVRSPNSHHHRKSATSQCTQSGIYPDILDCSLFHYCHENKHHEIIKCPKGLNFDPKTFLCSPSQLVNCQYEPSTKLEDEANNLNSNQYSGIFLDEVCRDYAPGTYLPMPNHFDEFIICGNNGGSILMKCKSGFIYNALTTACENGPCTFDSTLCENDGRCIDDPIIEKGFKCLCSNQYEGEFCEKAVNLQETTEQINIKPMIYSNSDNHPQTNSFDQTTHLPYTEPVKLLRKNLPSQDKSVLYSNSDEHQPFDQLLKMGLTFIAALFGIILFGAIICGIMILTRLICCPLTQTVGEWNTLREESSV